MDKLSRINYILTETCNLHCKFCFQNNLSRSSNKLTHKEIIDFTNFVIKNYKKDKNNSLDLNLIGGEPLLFNDFTIFIKVINLYNNNNFKINTISIFSNLSIENLSFEKFLEYVYDKVFDIKIISTVNTNNKYPNRLFGKNIENQQKYIQKLKSKFPNINIYYDSSVLDKKVLKNYEKILEYNFNHIDEVPDMIMPEYISQKENIDKEDVYKMCKIFFKLVDKYKLDIHNDNIIKYINKSALRYLKVLLFNFLDEYRIISCEPFQKEIGVSPGGYLSPCSRALEFKTDFPTIYDNPNFENFNIFHNDKKQFQTETGDNCLECLLRTDCTSCKFMPAKYIIKNNIFINPKEKCLYKLEHFNAQYEALKEYLSRRNDEKS